MIDKAKIGENMRTAREALSVSRPELALRVNMYPDLIRRYEKGEVDPGIMNLVDLANALGIGLDTYVAGKPQNLSALRPVSRERVEKVCRGCADCKRKTCVSCRRFGRVPQRCVDCNDQDKWSPWNFCPVCGKPLPDEAVDMVMERFRTLSDDN